MRNEEKVAAASLKIFFSSLFLFSDSVHHPVWIRELCFGVAGAEKFRIRNMGEDKVSAALKVFEEALKALRQSVMTVVKVIIRGNNETIHRFSSLLHFPLDTLHRRLKDKEKRKKEFGLLRIYTVFKHIWSKSDSAEETEKVSVAQVVRLFLTHNRKSFFLFTQTNHQTMFL